MKPNNETDHGWHGYQITCPECEGETRITAVAFNAKAKVLFQARCRHHNKCGARLQAEVPLEDIIITCLKLDGYSEEVIKEAISELGPSDKEDTALTSRYL